MCQFATPLSDYIHTKPEVRFFFRGEGGGGGSFNSSVLSQKCVCVCVCLCVCVCVCLSIYICLSLSPPPLYNPPPPPILIPTPFSASHAFSGYFFVCLIRLCLLHHHCPISPLCIMTSAWHQLAASSSFSSSLLSFPFLPLLSFPLPPPAQPPPPSLPPLT